MNETAPRRFRTVPKQAIRVDMTVEEFAEAVLSEMKAEAPVAVFVAWEVPNGMLRIRCIPDSETLKRGMTMTLYEHIVAQNEERNVE